METKRIYISGGKWITHYEPHDMPGGMVRVAYALTPTDGSGNLVDGEYRGLVPVEGILRIVYGGESLHGYAINQTLVDYKVEFLEEENKEYLAGFKRGFLGKRQTTGDYFEKQSLVWKDAYQNGRYWRMQARK